MRSGNATDALRGVASGHSDWVNSPPGTRLHDVARRHAMGVILRVGLIFLSVAVLPLLLREAIGPDPFLLFLSLWESFCFFMLWRRIDWGGYRFTSFGPVFLIASAFFKLFSFFDVLIFGNRIESWRVYADDPLLCIAYGQVIFFVGALVLVGTWVALRGHERSIAIIKSWKIDRLTVGTGYVVGSSIVFARVTTVGRRALKAGGICRPMLIPIVGSQPEQVLSK